MADRNEQPRNLEGLLRFAVEHTSEGDPDTDNQPMTDDRRQFLQAAMAELSGPGPVDRIKAILQDLSNYFDREANTEAPKRTDDLLEELEELTEWCEDIDVAKDFHKVGGFVMLPVLEDCENDEFRWRCGNLIAALCQNNIYNQQHLLNETDQLDRLMKIAGSSNESSIVRVKAFYAISSFIRGYLEAQNQFVQKHGYGLLLLAMQDNSNSSLRVKATFLLMSMMRDSDVHKKELTRRGCVEQILTLLNQPHEQYHEHIMAALLELLTNNKEAVQESLRPDLHMSSFLEDRLNHLSGKPEHQEEIDSVKEIQKLIAGYEEKSVDR